MSSEIDNDERPAQGTQAALFKTFFLLPFRLDDGAQAEPTGGWKHVSASMSELLSNPRHLAEYLYFHPHVRSFLYDLNSTTGPSAEGQLQYYELDNLQGEWSVKVASEGAPRPPISANIPAHGVSCYRFYNGICVLAIECVGEVPVSDALDFNNLARRLYASFGGVSKQIELGEFPADQRLRLPMASGADEYLLDWGEFNPNAKTESGSFTLEPREVFQSRGVHPLVLRLLGALFPGRTGRLLLDDRMLVLSRFAIQGHFPPLDPLRARHEVLRSRGMWVDSGANLDQKAYNETFLSELEAQASNRRWSHIGGEMGFSRYSAFFMGYGKSQQVDERGHVKGDLGFLFDHLDTMYLKMFVMAAFYRVSLLDLSGKIADLVKTRDELKQVDRNTRLALANRIKGALGEVVLFSNRYWFTELSNQDQGIEIFDLMRKVFRLDEMFDALKSDVQRTDTFLDSLLAIDELESNRSLGIWGFIIGCLAVLTGFFGMNIFGNCDSVLFLPNGFWVVLVSVLCGAAILGAIGKFVCKRFHQRNKCCVHD